jgi:hypothetical protein
MSAAHHISVVLAVSLATAACAATGTGMHRLPLGVEEDVIVLTVSSAHPTPVNIDLIRDGSQTRLGTVPSYSRRDFELPLRFSHGRVDAKLRATSMTLGAPSVQYAVTFRPRQEIELRVGFELRHSRITMPFR